MIKDLESDGTLASARIDSVNMVALGVTSLGALTWEIIDSTGNLILTTA